VRLGRPRDAAAAQRYCERRKTPIVITRAISDATMPQTQDGSDDFDATQLDFTRTRDADACADSQTDFKDARFARCKNLRDARRMTMQRRPGKI
jgi:hypothetical protein